jgi:ElaB/YqjD/DUF883 family membrane-anchored ribosome-binding protein
MVLRPGMNDGCIEPQTSCVRRICPKEAAMKTATEPRAEHAEDRASANGAQKPACCQQAAEKFQIAREKARSLTEVALQFVREHPVRSLIGAFEAGMVVGLLSRRRR